MVESPSHYRPFYRGGEQKNAVDIDTGLELLANSQRRAILEQLVRSPESRQDVNTLVSESMIKRTGEIPVERAKIATYHQHLPKLADAGVVDFDPDDETVYYHRDNTIERLLEAVIQLDR